MKRNVILLLLSSLLLLFTTPSHAQLFKKNKKNKTETPKKDKKKNKDSKVKPYDEVITEKAISDEGLFTVHKVGSKNYFEIPDDILEKEILIVSRISGFVKNLNFGGAGVKSRPQQVIRWQKMDEMLMLRSVSYNSVASEEDPIYKSVRNNNFEPIIATFDLAAYNKDSTAYVIEVSPLFTKDVAMIGAMSTGQRKRFEINGLDSKRSMIVGMKAFPKNVEVRHVLTYKGKKLPDNNITQTLSVEMNQSFIILPDEPMQPRYYDDRVGYFSITQTDYSSEEHYTHTKRYITRWRLEPKDMDAYKRGELVEPKKQIVYYIDPATPTKWIPYIKQGVDDWQPAFEAAGFKNAIVGKVAPTPEEDSEFSPEDTRYSVLRYVSTDIQNAMGPHVHDPRSGEILESDIIWYHNIQKLLRNWFMMQTAAANPAARKVKFSDELMGQLIRFVSAHEVGHTLGLPHNMGSSVAYSIDSLRSPTFTANHGTAPSIMDYARFNHVAQPEDGVTNFYPMIGEYDIWSIIYGYKLVPNATSAEEERATLNRWIKQRASDPIYRYGRQRFNTFDPTSQTEDLGDDLVLSGELGIANLKRIVPNLIKWSAAAGEGKDYDQLEEMYESVYGQMGKYLRHVTTYIGGVIEQPKTTDQAGPVYLAVPKPMQQRAMKFLDEQIFQTPEWLLDKEILQRIEPAGATERLRRVQSRVLNQLFDAGRLKRLDEAESLYGQRDVFNLLDLFAGSKSAIFREVYNGTSIDAYRRNLQRAYVDKMSALMKIESNDVDHTNIKSIARGNLKVLKGEIQSAVARQTDTFSKYHLEDLMERIEMILNPK
ncbi:MAG: zinc-dependent metalloprotease [Bacteroidota bacterium]